MPDYPSITGAEAEPRPASSAPVPRGPEAEPKNRRIEWSLVVVAALAAVPLWLWRGGGGPGTVIEVPLTLVTADKHALTCALNRPVGRYRCAFSAPDAAWPTPPSPADTLTQYLTTERRLLLIPGLFEQPALRARYESERPQGRRLSELHRFTATCRVRLLEKVQWVHTRWAKRGKWDRSEGAWVVEPLGCTTQED